MSESTSSEKMATKWQDRDVASQIDELQRVYRRWTPWYITLGASGAAMMCATDNSRIIAAGLFLAITGMVNVTLMKTWAHIKLSTLGLVRQLQEHDKAHSQ